uniref:Uncharacterized protein n=1 Tax=viral metagenome TaxID=1070528 RepID=A0A6C0AFY5_9ZZZZ
MDLYLVTYSDMSMYENVGIFDNFEEAKQIGIDIIKKSDLDDCIEIHKTKICKFNMLKNKLEKHSSFSTSIIEDFNSELFSRILIIQKKSDEENSNRNFCGHELILIDNSKNIIVIPK